MNRATFFKHFDLLADQPDAVAKMRELVLELAVRGKLVSKDPQPDKSPAWLKWLKAIDERLYSGRPVCGYDPASSASFEIPEHWRWVVLDDVAAPCGQKKPDAKFSYVDVGAIDNERGLIKENVEVIAAENAPSRARKLVVQNAVIYSTVRPYLKNIAVIDRKFLPPAIVSTAFAVLNSKEFLNPRYLFYWLRSRSFQTDVEAKMKGVAYPAISDSEFWECFIPVPPPGEQRRIVAKVEELMALCDELEKRQQALQHARDQVQQSSLHHLLTAREPQTFAADWQRVRDHFHLLHDTPDAIPQLRQTILQLAVQGRLLPQDNFLERGKQMPEIRQQSPSQNGDKPSFDVPSDWHWRRLGQVSELINGDRSKNYPNKAEYAREGVAWINTGHIEPDGTLSLETMNYITRAKFDSLRSGKIQPGDLVYCLRGATLGKTAIISQFKEGAVASSLVIIRLAESITPKYAYYFLTSPLGRQQIWKFDNGSAQPNLSAESVKKYWIPIPPLAEQKRIVTRVQELLRWCDTLEAQLHQTRTLGEHLLNSTLHHLLKNQHDT